MFICKKWNHLFKRVLGLRNRKIHTTRYLKQEDTVSDDLEKILKSDGEYKKLVDHYFHLQKAHMCLVIQPYVKWGPKKLNISSEEQLSEAIALIHTLPGWTVENTVIVPLDTLERKALFKSGSMNKIKSLVQSSSNISAIFINSNALKKVTVQILQDNFQRPILDRYKIVMQILKAHATSKHAKLQVALAELYYLQRKSEQDLFFRTYNSEALRLMFQDREQKLKRQINTLRAQRSLLRSKRQKLDYPVVAVVGYTNAGKTSLIKALTGEESLQPKNQLFATLDVTVHEGVLPSGLDLLYVDTVGFISDIPTNLIECFVATLEDALLADVILLVEDLSSKSFEYKQKHVLDTLKNLGNETESKDILDKIIYVGNKCDLIENEAVASGSTLSVSAQKGIGLEELRHQLESFILTRTGRQKILIKVPNGGDEIRWLFKNSVVLQETPDTEDTQCIIAKVIITQANLQKFKHHFVFKNT